MYSRNALNCTFNPFSQDITQWLVKKEENAQDGVITIPSKWGICTTVYSYQFSGRVLVVGYACTARSISKPLNTSWLQFRPRYRRARGTSMTWAGDAVPPRHSSTHLKTLYVVSSHDFCASLTYPSLPELLPLHAAPLSVDPSLPFASCFR